MKLGKTILINFIILILGIIFIELIFGSWLVKKNAWNNLGVIRNEKLKFHLDGLYKNNSDTIIYTRDSFGLRGASCFNKPFKIDILTIGGSTTDQRFIEDGKTWQDFLEKEFLKIGKSLVIANAGIDGQSTFGHIKNFQSWFNLIPDLKPKYTLFYIGINDFYKESNQSTYDDLNGNYSIKSKIKINSCLYNLWRKMDGMYKIKKANAGHSRIQFSKLTYTEKGILSLEARNHFFGNKLNEYKVRISILIKMCEKMKTTPIFITQPNYKYKYISENRLLGVNEIQEYGEYKTNGIDYYYLTKEMNRCIEEVVNKKYQIINLTDRKIWEEEDFYDYFHMTPIGTKKVAKELFINLTQTISK